MPTVPTIPAPAAYRRCRTPARWTAVVLLAVLGVAHGQTGTPVPAEQRRLVAELRDGGYVIYFRHAQTDWAQQDDVRGAGDWTSCDPERMRQLSDAGRRSARAVGRAMRRLDIPVSGVYASEYCRCVETAELLDLAPVETTRDILNARAAEYIGGTEALRASARRRLGTPPPEGSNTVLVAHGNVFLLAADQRPPEGGAAIVRPEGEARFTVLDVVPSAHWVALGRSPESVPPGADTDS